MRRPGFDRRDVALIALGGLLGATLRWSLMEAGTTSPNGGWFAYEPDVNVPLGLEPPGIPWVVLVVNLLGTFLLGAVLWLRSSSLGSRRLWLTIGTGFCGSLTTFSTFAVEIAGRLGPASNAFTVGTSLSGFSDASAPNVMLSDPWPGRFDAALYLAISVCGAVAAFALGRQLARRIAP